MESPIRVSFLSLIDTESNYLLLFSPWNDELDLSLDFSNTFESLIELSFNGVNFLLFTLDSNAIYILFLRLTISFQWWSLGYLLLLIEDGIC